MRGCSLGGGGRCVGGRQGVEEVCGLWVLSGPREVEVGLPLRVYLCENTGTHNAIASYTHPFPGPARLAACTDRGRESQEEAQGRDGGSPVSKSAAPPDQAAIISQTTPARPPAPLTDVPGAPKATRRLPPSERGGASAGDKEARETGEVVGL